MCRHMGWELGHAACVAQVGYPLVTVLVCLVDNDNYSKQVESMADFLAKQMKMKEYRWGGQVASSDAVWGSGLLPALSSTNSTYYRSEAARALMMSACSMHLIKSSMAVHRSAQHTLLIIDICSPASSSSHGGLASDRIRMYNTLAKTLQDTVSSPTCRQACR